MKTVQRLTGRGDSVGAPGAAGAPAGPACGGRRWRPPAPLYALEATLDGGIAYSIASLRDGRVVCGRGDRTLKVWHRRRGHVLTLTGHTSLHNDCVGCVTVLDDGRIVSGAGDCTVKVWDANDGSCLQTLEGHAGSVHCVAGLPGGRVVSGAGFPDLTLLVWDVDSGTPLVQLVGHDNHVQAVATTADGLVISGSDAPADLLIVWDSSAGDRLRTLDGHKYGITCIVVLSDGRAISSDGETVKLWNVYDASCLLTLAVAAESIALLPGDRIVTAGFAVAGEDADEDDSAGVLKILDLTDGRCLQTLAAFDDFPYCVAALPDGRLATGSGDGTLRIWVDQVRVSEKCMGALVARERAFEDVVKVVGAFL